MDSLCVVVKKKKKRFFACKYVAVSVLFIVTQHWLRYLSVHTGHAALRTFDFENSLKGREQIIYAIDVFCVCTNSLAVYVQLI